MRREIAKLCHSNDAVGKFQILSRRPCVGTEADVLPTTDARDYGSLRSQGRRNIIRLASNSGLRATLARKEKPRPAGETGRGLRVRSPLQRPDNSLWCDYSTTWITRRERGSTSTVWPFTTV
jgi:hypothetical protein